MKTKFKKIVLILLSAIMILSLGLMTACNGENPDSGKKDDPKTTITVTLDKATGSLQVGESLTLTATVKGSDDKVVWTSSNTAKATVENGVVTAVEVGSATITATVGDAKATCEITVTETTVPVINLNNATTQIYKGQPLNLNAEVVYKGTTVTDAEIVYSSTNTDVVTVDANGVIRGIGKGTADITVNCTYDGKVATEKTVTIKVVNLTVVSFTTEDEQTLKTGDTITLNAFVTLNGDEVTDPDITYSLSNDKVAAIDGENVLKAKSAIDALVITATFIDGEDTITDSIVASIDYSVAFSGAVELLPTDNSGNFLVKTDKQFEKASINGSELTLVADAEGYNVDLSVFDLDKTSQEIILTDSDGIEYVANIYNTIKEVSGDIVKVRTDADFAGAASMQTGVNAYDRTNVTLVSGNPNKTWQNVFYFEYNDYLAKGYGYLAFDLLFKKGDGNLVGITGSDGEFVNLTIDSPVVDDEIALYDAGHNVTNFVEVEWQTVIIKLESFTNMIQCYSLGGMSAYIDNVRFMSEGSYNDYVENYFTVEKPDVLRVSLDNAIANPGSDYMLVRAEEPVEYQGKTAIDFTGTNEATWRNNLLISAEYYKSEYKWLLVDFVFNTDDVQFDVLGTINNYAPLPFGSCCNNGSFYVVKEINEKYYSVGAIKNQWITVAFRLDDMRTYVNCIIAGAVDTYVANIRAVKENVFDEVEILPNTISNTSILSGYYTTVGRDENVALYSRSGLVHITGASGETWKNEWKITGLNDFKSAGYSYLAIDILFQTQGITDCIPYAFFVDADNAISIPVGGSPSNTALKLYDVGHNETTLGDTYWTTFMFDLSKSTIDYVSFFSLGASEWYIDTITAMTEAEHTAFLTKPAKVEVDPFGFVTKNLAKTTVDDIGDRDGVTQFTSGATVAWYDYNTFIYTNQYVSAGYNTFSVDIYLDGTSNLSAYYLNNNDLSTITFGSTSSVDGIKLSDASGSDVSLGSGAWYTLKFDITKVTHGAINLIKSEPSVTMYLTNAYYENIA